jgi:bifunctional ADP-heptose synthase (sugar kinase/adenylyltransferase)
MNKLDFSKLKIAVFGDYCLDEYLWVDAALNEPSLETGLVAYQCTKREVFSGAAGTIAKNLANLEIGTVYAVGYVGDDGRGHDLCQALDKLNINRKYLITAKDRLTPTYTKPWLTEDGKTRELSRIDTKNWTATPSILEEAALQNLRGLVKEIDALIIMDQMTEENCGIVTERVRKELAHIARFNPNLLVYADSRCRTHLFEDMMIKGNEYEIPLEICAERAKIKPVIRTMGEKGLAIYTGEEKINIEGIPAEGQTDVCGAGDMFTAAFVSALCAGASLEDAGKLGNKAASICVAQLGTSGHVTRGDLGLL